MFVDSLAHALMDAEFGKNDYTSPNATHYFSLLTDIDSLLSDGTGYVETSYTDYARVSKTNNATTWPNAASRKKKCGVVLTFPEAASAGGQIVAVGVHTASSGTGNMIAVAKLTTPETISTGNIPSFAADALEFEALGTSLLS